MADFFFIKKTINFSYQESIKILTAEEA